MLQAAAKLPSSAALSKKVMRPGLIHSSKLSLQPVRRPWQVRSNTVGSAPWAAGDRTTKHRLGTLKQVPKTKHKHEDPMSKHFVSVGV